MDLTTAPSLSEGLLPWHEAKKWCTTRTTPEAGKSRGLGPSTTSEELQQLFKVYGALSVEAVQDREGQVPRS